MAWQNSDVTITAHGSKSVMEPWLQSSSSNFFPGSLTIWQTEVYQLQVWDWMVWVLLVFLLLPWLMTLIESISSSVPVPHHWRIKPAICMICCSMLYILVTKTLKPFRNLALQLQWWEPKKLLREDVFIWLICLSSFFHRSSLTQPVSETASLAIWAQTWYVKKGALQGRDSQLKGKQVAFVKWISQMEIISLFHYGSAERIKIRRMIEGERK